MSMNEFRRTAAKMDQHMQPLSAEGVNDADAIINRMMGYTPETGSPDFTATPSS